jgi:predicted nucleic acid-binding protein
MSETFFFDTYALFEIIRGNPNYAQYKNKKAIITIFNLAEFNYNLKKEHTKGIADKISGEYKQSVVKVSFNDITEAMDMKSKNRHLSIPDVIGYAVAKRLNIKFLTGDKEFANLQNVEFVK